MWAFLHDNLKMGKQVSDVECAVEEFNQTARELSVGKSLNFRVQIS